MPTEPRLRAESLRAKPPDALPVVRVITRLNIGGPSIQATRLTDRLEPHGFATTLIHGRLGDGEGDMSYLIAPGAHAIYLETLRRPLSPVADVRALWRLYRELKRARRSFTPTWPRRASGGRLAATAYNLTRGGAPRARVIHTYHGTCSKGISAR